jgi:hypothetical protein
MLSDIWSAYNGEDSWSPFYFPLVIWISTLLYCYLPFKQERPTFHRWHALHSFHNYGAIFLGLISMYFDDDSMFNERIPILWSTGYFLVDVVDCGYRQDATYLAHAVLCLVLGVANYTTPLCRQLRMNSKATLCELSNGFMHLAKRTRKPLHFVAFAIVFTICRVFWIPYLMQQILAHGMPPTDPIFICLASFYGLNLFWWYKIVRIIVKGPSTDSTEMKSE